MPAVALAAVLLAGIVSSAGAEAVRAKPNVVLIVTDDQRWDTLAYMPQVTKLLVERGVTFTNAFVTTPLCCPSRASILTGLYAHDHGVRDVLAPHGGATAFDARSTLATWLRDAGYVTGYVGKYMNDYATTAPIPPGWADWLAFAGPASYFDYQLNDNGKLIGYGSGPSEYSTDVLKERAVGFVRANAARPFFLVYAPFGPHAPVVPALRHRGMLAKLTPYRPASWREADVTDKPSWWTAQQEALDRFDRESTADRFRSKQLESLQSVDEAVRDIVAAIERDASSSNTMIIFTSDNGIVWGEHGATTRFKNCPYEECIRVPLVIRYPALVAAPRREERNVLNVDIAPTIAALAGAALPSDVDGRSWVGMLADLAGPWRTDILIEAWNFDNPNRYPGWKAARNGRWKYIVTRDPGLPPTDGAPRSPVEVEELYDLSVDPFETDNVAAQAPDVVQVMKARLVELQAEY